MQVILVQASDLETALRDQLLEIDEVRISDDRAASEVLFKQIEETLIERYEVICLGGAAIRKVCRDEGHLAF